MEREESICVQKEGDDQQTDRDGIRDLQETNRVQEKDFGDNESYDNYEDEDNLEERLGSSDKIMENNELDKEDKILNRDSESRIDDSKEVDDDYREIEDEEEPECKDGSEEENDKEEELENVGERQKAKVTTILNKIENINESSKNMDHNLATIITTKRKRKPTARTMEAMSAAMNRSRPREKRSRTMKCNVKSVESDTGLMISDENINKPTLSLSASTSTETGTVTSTTAAASTIAANNVTSNAINAVTQKKNRKRRDSSTSSEEERWLNAIESGKLEEVEVAELRKMKDPKLMTARQRAIYDRNHEVELSSTKAITAKSFDIDNGSGSVIDENLSNLDTTANRIESDCSKATTIMALPTLSANAKDNERQMTTEELQKAALKIQRRKQQADERREKDKKKTMERLLKKQETKQRSGAKHKPRNNDNTEPMIKYCTNSQGVTIQFPPDYQMPLVAQRVRLPPPPVKLCSIEGCNQPKKYNCSKTNLPLCSLECYRKNIQASKNVIC